ncbi:hypothetical protein [Streptomyces nodosus]|uniref:Uncharacterized protein n=1 Tax=Streptomyces nodosus TaxID=40318 RepID=A0A0B5DPW2_9ACTN|nr:hypothetical protein [Streptomyces nodosus]AJE42112.1 hypothetical protein SNOD_20290 [Streptomyces nodosus]MBB4793372.1 hypothetical protein [Streptomyces nodosus]QEV40632.1 hypothetical protein CP978_20625 [Streptomyces nodosus]
MSFGEPNDPYGPPPQQQPPAAPPYGYPQQPAAAPDYGHPQQPAGPPPGYGFPQQPAYAGYPGYPAHPGGNAIPQSMPGLLATARVFLYIIAAVQIVAGLIWLYAAAFFNDVSNEVGRNSGSSSPLDSISDGGHMAAGLMLFIALIALGLAALSITLGVKFGRGGQGVRITTVVYGALGGVIGLLGLITALRYGAALGVIFPLLWVVFAAVIIAAPVSPSGTAWFRRPRY